MAASTQPTPRALLFALALTAVALYAPLIGWGLPHATGPDRIKTFATDEILPLEGLAEMRSTVIQVAPDRNYGYPWWHYFVVSAAQGPYLATLWLTGDLSTPSSTYPFGLREPVRSLEILTLIGRLVSVVMAAGIVVASFLFAQAFWGRTAGLVAAILTMVSYPMFYYSRTGNLDVPAFFWSAMGLTILARMMADGITMKRAAWLGLFAALGVATKDQAVLLFLPACFAPFVDRKHWNVDGGFPWRAFATLVLAGCAAYVAATGMLIDPNRHLTHVYSLFFDPGRVSRSAHYFQPVPSTWQGTMALVSDTVIGLAAWFTWPVLLAATAGAAIAIRATAWHGLWLVPFVTTFVLLVRLPGNAVLRYFLPLTLFIDAFAALSLVRLKASHPRAFGLMFALIVASRLVIGMDLTFAQWTDTRYAAGEWLLGQYRPGDRIEYFGVADTLPPLALTMVSRRIAGAGEAGRGPAVLKYLLEEGPRFVLVIPDWTSRAGLERSADCPPDVYAALIDGSAGYTLAAHFPSPSLLRPPLSRPRLDTPSVAPPVRIFTRMTRSADHR